MPISLFSLSPLRDAGSDAIHLMTRPRSQVLIYLDLLEATMGAILIRDWNTIDKKMLQFVVVVVLF